MFGKFVKGKLNRAFGKGKKLILSVGLTTGLLAALACQAPAQTVEVEVTREIPITRVHEVTREVPVTREVEVTRQVEVTRNFEVTREVEVTRQIEVPREAPVIEQVEVTREVEVTRTVEVIREVPVIRVATATPPLYTPTPRPTPTPTVDLTATDKANLWIAIYDAGYSTPRIRASANPAFDVDVYDLDVIVRAGRLSETFLTWNEFTAMMDIPN